MKTKSVKGPKIAHSQPRAGMERSLGAYAGAVSDALSRTELVRLARRALEEDVGSGDVTTEATVAADARARATIAQKEPGVIYGLDAAEAVFAQLDPQARCEPLVAEGLWRDAGGPVLAVEGLARALLTGERTALNFLAHLSGVATMAARAARAVEGTGARVLDTRKTTPGLRALEKAAVAAGGATNHRAGLYDAILIKENHIAAAGGIARAVALARAAAPALADTLEVEVRDPEEIAAALAAGAPRLLLDNMDNAQLRAAVAQVAGRAQLEASGGVTLQTLLECAQTGVEWVSMGALTHSAPALDLSLILKALP
jgi:nicotinate-nucleotide pyrophosphorylase (carboxylating)